MSESILRVGVVGTGIGGAVHVPGLQQIAGVEVVAVAGEDPERARSVAVRHGIADWFDDYRTMLRRCRLDAVTIAAPVDAHHSVAVAAAEEGLHILCETPMARTAAEARDMYRLVRDLGIQHAVVASGRYTAARIRYKQLVASGYVGDLQSVCVTVYRSPRPARGAGLADPDGPARNESLLQAIGSDYVDALRWWFGEIHAVAGARAAADLLSGTVQQRDACFSVLLQFESGATGTIYVNAASPVNLGDEVVAMGTEGVLALRGDGRLFGTRRHEQSVSELEVPEELRAWLPSYPDPRLGPFIVLAREWVAAIRAGDGFPPSFEDGMKVQEVVDAVIRSQELSRWIDTSGRKWPVSGRVGRAIDVEG